ncbi:Ribosome biogenesis protein, NOL1/NOP2/fmu family [Pseudarcicella hirudinis]|uniref:Ribosome biogenesis protein, NOL1/NOP2/fmu family n=1 Tax=Pseudarcicella hirudinis TaxID=1079859 RepID=A0A1I5RXR9_9BACT|nr:hypothetical protein [Pseudarcicella hirudinis]SFP63227.1 Ribosome biogenesis protein, NOL1/NOP2/fmu family [Pseudarcicella hirudinis]
MQEQGVLIYTGNTGSAEQHLNVLEWMKEEFGIRNLPLEIPETFKDWKNFVLNEFKSEKQIVSGFCLNKTEENESFFVAVFRKTTAQRPFELRRTKPQINKNRRTERGMLGKWIKNIEEYTWFEKKGNIYLINPEHENILRIFQQNFQLIKAGLNAGKFAGGDLVPEHELAYSEVLGDQIQKVGLNTEEALKYIRREDFQIDRTVTGWVLISYRNCPLGWAKILSNRINNYYPKEQRMVKDA